MTANETELVIVYRTVGSPFHGSKWEPVKKEDIPSWVMTPEVMHRLLCGEIACKSGVIHAPEAEEWYMVRSVRSLQEEIAGMSQQ